MQDADCIVNQQMLNVDIEAYERARSNVIARIVNAFRQNKIPLFAPPPASTIVEYIRENYELVCLFNAPDKAAEASNMRQRFTPKQTDYGLGLQMSPLTQTNVAKHVSGAGQAVAWVALAFRGRQLQAKHPFRIGRGKEMEKKANLTFKKFKEDEAFSCVHLPALINGAPVPRGQDAAAAAVEQEDEVLVDENQDIVFWYQNAVIPLFIATIKLNSQCCICMEHFARDNKLGGLCPDNHFVCWGCFGEYINAASAPGAINYADAAGRLCCPNTTCRKGYDIFRNAVHAPEEITQALRAFETSNIVRKEVAEARDEAEKFFNEELERVKAMTEKEQELYHLKREICENILNVHCPRCRTVFVDFDGCFALTCGNANCRAGFCAWCQKDCERDAHAHVPHCPEGNGNIYGDVRLLQPTWNRIRVRKIRALLQTKSAAIRREVLDQIKKEVEDLGIRIEDLQV